jgi:hypothetical protein
MLLGIWQPETAVVEAMNRPLVDWEHDEADRLQPEIDAAKSKYATVEVRIKILRQKAAKAKPEEFEKLSQEIAELEKDLPTIPTLPVLFCSLTM